MAYERNTTVAAAAEVINATFGPNAAAQVFAGCLTAAGASTETSMVAREVEKIGARALDLFDYLATQLNDD